MHDDALGVGVGVGVKGGGDDSRSAAAADDRLLDGLLFLSDIFFPAELCMALEEDMTDGRRRPLRCSYIRNDRRSKGQKIERYIPQLNKYSLYRILL